MKVSINDIELFTLTETQKNVLKNDIVSTDFDDDMKRRLQWIISNKYDSCFKRLKDEWEPKLAARGVQSIPTDKDLFAQLVLSQPDYKDRAARDVAEAAAKQL